ncbi:MAG: DEAD/DEAH box helicase, partial [Candidatus Brocadiia bacterium]|nr:DEAD/DEAH box helicase [Candidatus Brocadiia bacterium]
MDFDAFLNEIKAASGYAGQIVYVREVAAREARYADTAGPVSHPVQDMLRARGIERLYTHQARAIDLAREGRNVLTVTGTASGKTLCYTVPIIEMLLADPAGRALLLFPTKALCQDQFKGFREALSAAGMPDVMAGVYDGDTPSPMRRKLRDHGSVIFTNPDMLHAALMPQHGRWADFLARLRILVIDELHVYNGIFGSNAANLFRRFFRICRHYGSDPQVISCSATIGNPKELGERLIGEEMVLVDRDGSPRGKRTYVFWNPPTVRKGHWRSRRSANVEAHELMAMLVQRGVPTIT